MTRGALYIDSNMDMERLVTLLANNGYKVQVRQDEGIDAFSMRYRIDYKRADEWEEEDNK